MARRVMELEQDAAEMRAISLQSHAAAAADNNDENENTCPAGPIDTPGHNKEWAGRGSFGSKRGSIGSGSERAEERVLRAKNEMLERQLEHMKEEAEETELELAAARKVGVIGLVGWLSWWVGGLVGLIGLVDELVVVRSLVGRLIASICWRIGCYSGGP